MPYFRRRRYVAKRKRVSTKKKAPTRRYRRRTSLVAKVNQLARTVRPELKNLILISDGTVAQVDAAVTGAAMFEFTPQPSPGTGSNGRVGSVITLKMIDIQCQLWQMSAVTDSMTVIFDIWAPSEPKPVSLVSTGNEIYNLNPFSLVIDNMSRRNPDHYHSYRRVATKRVTVPKDQFNNTMSHKTFSWKVRMNHNCRYNSVGTIVGGQLLMIIRADVGNKSTVTASTDPDLPVTAINTGMNFKMQHAYYYTDQ